MRIVRTSVSFIGPIDTIEGLTALCHAIPGIRETAPGVFGSKGRPWLQIRQDADGLVAEIRRGKSWQRFHMSEHDEQEAFMAEIGRSF
ncbi:hypothetical protein [Inquilinus limosus]|uniref:Uncharacterized protein n=1 Tax=Inquilinus limosus MP06 TaxID=1398085 RepID=A0A0A0DAN8_9PROT|nr:hypothetical protein [Inquilinus limosus]KGM35766.1 hypothetical protein P409_02465 [Inquilinus limosus MP06]